MLTSWINVIGIVCVSIMIVAIAWRVYETKRKKMLLELIHHDKIKDVDFKRYKKRFDTVELHIYTGNGNKVIDRFSVNTFNTSITYQKYKYYEIWGCHINKKTLYLEVVYLGGK